MLMIEDNKKIKVVLLKKTFNVWKPLTQTIFCFWQTKLYTQQVLFHDNYASLNNPPQKVDKSCHLCDSISTTDAGTLLSPTEKIQSTQQGHKKSHNVGTRLLSGFLVSFASGVVESNCWMKQQSNTQKQGAPTAIQTGCSGALHRSQSLTALNR